VREREREKKIKKGGNMKISIIRLRLKMVKKNK